MNPTIPLEWSIPDFAHDAVGTLVLGGAFLALFAVAEACRCYAKLSPELTRKLVHAGAGVALLFLPRLLSSMWSCVALAVVFFALMLATKRLGLLQSVHGVGRRTTGAVVYPVAILVLVVLSRGAPARYDVPLLILALADPAAAIVGTSIGKLKFHVRGQQRTLEGSSAFFAVAWAAAFIALWLVDGVGWSHALAVAACLGFFLVAVEALATGGWDNLAIPVAGTLIVQPLVDAQPAALALAVFTGCALTAAALVAWTATPEEAR